MPVVLVKIGDHYYHGLCDLGSSVSVVPFAYIEKPPFPVKIKEHAKVSTVVNKSYIRTPKPDEQITAEQLIEKRKVMTISKAMIMNIGITSMSSRPKQFYIYYYYSTYRLTPVSI